MHQPVAEYVAGMIAERDLCRSRALPEDYPAFPAELARGQQEIFRRRAEAIDQQLNDLIAVLADKGLI